MINESALRSPHLGRANIIMLVAGSFLATIGRGATLPFLPLFLHNQLGMSIIDTGTVLTLSMVAGILLSIPSGKLANYFSHKKLLTLSLLVFALAFIILGSVYSVVVFVISFTLINCAYALYSTIIKCFISDNFHEGEKTKLFSLNYTFINIGWMAGPAIGAALSRSGTFIPFALSALTGLLAMALTARLKVRATASDQHSRAGNSHPGDKKRFMLLVFTAAIFLGSFVFDRFASCISQILMVDSDAVIISRIISLLITTNALTVVLFQYAIGRWLERVTDRLGFLLGTLGLIVGLFLFSQAERDLPLWIVGMFIFSFGEIIFMPLQYRVIDRIAPAQERAFYFSFQNLGSLGGAINPVITGVLLTLLPRGDVFAVLIAASLVCCVVFQLGLLLVRRQSGPG